MKKFVVVPHDPKWGTLFDEERRRLISRFGEMPISIHHIGSTSIPNIYAKPVIDILVDVANLEQIDAQNSAMISMGYEVMGEFGIPGRRYFRKDIEGVRTFQVHAFQVGSDEIVRHLSFRDYLTEHPDEAQAYSDLKVSLIAQYDGNPDDYMDGKDEFIKEIERKAELWRVRNSP